MCSAQGAQKSQTQSRADINIAAANKTITSTTLTTLLSIIDNAIVNY
jgi:hypothetical protein